MKTKYLLPFYAFLTFSLRAELPRSPAAAGREVPATGHLSLDELTRAVLENNSAIKEAENRWRAAKERVPQAAAWDDLKVAGDSEFHRYINVPPNAFMDQSLTVEQLVPITGKNLVHARAAAAEALSIFEEVRRAELDVISKARAAYFRLANAYDQLEINDENLTSLRQIADISRTRYENGLESAANVLVAETDHSKLLETRRDLERNLSDAQSQLNTLMNRDAFAPLGAPVAATVNQPSLSLNRLRAITLAQRPEVQMARAKIDTEKATFLDWISEQRSLRDIEATAREHLSDYQVAVAELEAIIGAQLYAAPNESGSRRTERKSR